MVRHRFSFYLGKMIKGVTEGEKEKKKHNTTNQNQTNQATTNKQQPVNPSPN